MKLPLVLLLGLLLAPLASAQTPVNPIQGAYTDIYLVAGRLLDAEGDPMPNARVQIEVDQRGVRAAPFQATANCKGDFIAYFNLRHVEPGGKLKITLLAPDGMRNVTQTVNMDPFFRRSDVVLTLDGDYGLRCPPAQDVFDLSVTVKARILNRTEEYLIEEEAFHARPSQSIVTLRYTMPDGQVICPPLPNGPPDTCELFVPDERGDMMYSFTLDAPFEAGGQVMLTLDNSRSFNATVDPVTRIALFHIEATGQGAPAPVRESPAAPSALLVLGVALVALALRAAKR